MDESHLRPTETTGLARKSEKVEKVHIPDSSSVRLLETGEKRIPFFGPNYVSADNSLL